jgi:hypothetical protein
MPIRVIECDSSTTFVDRIYQKGRIRNTKYENGKEKLVFLLMQQILPKGQDPLGRPLKREQTDPGTQIPASPLGLGDVQESKVSKEFPILGL